MNDLTALILTIAVSTVPSLLLYLLTPVIYDLGLRLRGEK